MLENETLTVLAEAAEIGLPEAATVPAAAFDPFFRPALKGRVRAALHAAKARARENAPADHVLRLAFLGAHPKAPVEYDPNDVRAVEQIFDALAAPYLPPKAARDARPGGAYRAGADRDPLAYMLADPPKRKRRFWPVTTSAVLAGIVSALGLGAFLVAPYVLPSPFERFRKTPVGEAMGDPLTDLVAEGSRRIDAEPRAKILSPAVKKQIGPEAFASLERAIDIVPVAAASSADTTDDAMAPVFLEVVRTDHALAAKKVPLLLHAYGAGQPGRRGVWLTAWFVERRDGVVIGDTSLDVVWGRRLDSLNLADSTIYKANAEDFAILSIERVEEELVQTLLSPIAIGTPLGPDAVDDTDKSASAELARAATPIVAAEVMAASGLSKSDADALRRVIAQRNEAAVGLAKSGYAIEASSRIELAPPLVRGLGRARDRDPGRRALVDEMLRTNERVAPYRKSVAPAVAEIAQIEEEELAARIALDAKLGDKPLPKLGRNGAWRRSRDVAGADLLLLAHARSAPRLALWRVGHAVVTGATDEAVAVVLGEVLRELGLLPRGEQPADVDDAFANALRAAFDLPPERVRDAAAKVFQDLFAMPAPAVAFRRPT
ncbi:MAG TPA: hypothetical protein VIF62_06895 [Labilithrix sp.]